MMERTYGAARARMVQRRAELLQLVEQNTAKADVDHAGVTAADWTDRAAGETAERVWASLSDRERREVQEIEAALRRMDDGTYGQCTGCGGAIGRGRLEAIPEAKLCVDCEERSEEAA